MYSGGFNGFGFFVFLGVSFGINQKKANFSIKIIKKPSINLFFPRPFYTISLNILLSLTIYTENIKRMISEYECLM